MVSDDIKELDELKKRMVEIEALAETRVLTEAEMFERSVGGVKIIEKARVTTMNLKQREKIKLEVEGDENTRFFHGYVNNRNMKNHIHRIMANGSWITNPLEIKREASKFFEAEFYEKWSNMSSFRHPSFRKLSESDARFLEGEFSLEEIKNAA